VSLEHRKFLRQERAKQDLQQYVLAEGAIKENPHRWATFTEKGLDPYKDVTCPFCLSLNPLRLFLISTKKGYDRGNGKCPLCQYKMKLQTLLKVMTSPEQYATFGFTYPAWRFWERTKKAGFETWKKRLAIMDWTDRFWNEYKRLRGDSPDAEREKELEEKWNEYEETVQA
jgi:hypothetical protein